MRKWLGIVLLGIMLVAPALAQERIETIYVVPMSHLDIGFTAPPSVVAKKMSDATDQALEHAAADPAYVWNFETFWQLEQWLNSKPPSKKTGGRPADPFGGPPQEKMAQLLQLLKSDRFGLGAAYDTPHSCLMSAWTLDWLFRLPTDWGKAHGLKLQTAILDDVPGHCGDLPHFLAKNGVRYLVVGSNLVFSPPLPAEVTNTPFWWEAPTGERVLTWISAHAYTDAYMETGFDPDCARFFNKKKFPDPDNMKVMEKGIGETLKRYEEKKYPYDAVLALHAFDNWGSGASVKPPRFAKMWNDAHTSPKIVPCAAQAFFEHIESKYGKQLPVYRGGFGGQWDSTRCGIPTAMRAARRAEEIVAAKKKPDLDDVRRLLTVYEHSFGMGPGWPGTMTREEVVQHDREQYETVASLPGAKKIYELENHKAETIAPNRKEQVFGLKSDCLYWVPNSPMVMPPNREEAFKPLPAAAWVGYEARDLGKGSRHLSYRIDRRKLPDPCYVLWLYDLPEAQAKAKVRNRTATGWETLPDDGLAGYTWGGWVSPWGFRLGDQEFKGDGCFAFRRLELAGRTWLLGQFLGQRLSSTFKPRSNLLERGKPNEKGALTFEEAYPGEPPVVEISVEIHKTGG